MASAAPASIVALLLASFLGLSLAILGTTDAKLERALTLAGLGLAGFGATAGADALLDLGVHPIGSLLAGGALVAFGAARLARSRR